MEKKNNIGNGMLVVLLFVVICFLVYYIVIANKGKNSDNIDDGRIIVNEKLKSDVTSTIDEYLLKIFDNHSIKYCGELDYDDTYISGVDTYSKNKSYSSISEIKKSYSSIITENYFDNVLGNKFIEKDGKLYCLTLGGGSLDYDSGNVKITDVVVDGNYLIVKGSYATAGNDMNPSDTFNFEISMVKENNLWVIDLYNEI